MVAIHSSGQTISGFTHMAGITLDVEEESDKVCGGASGKGVDSISEVGERTSQGLGPGKSERVATVEALKEKEKGIIAMGL
jgi:hypothetical protein